MKKIVMLLALVLCLGCVVSCDTDNGTDGEGSTTPAISTDGTTDAEQTPDAEPNMKLGAYVWYGYSYDGPHYTDRLKSEFAGREPIWGWVENSIGNMEYQIELALEYGLSFFAIDWYYQNPDLNGALTKFFRAKNNAELEFCLLVANHDGARITYNNWKDACKTFVRYMSKPNALKVDGKPVIIFYDIHNVVTDLGGPEKVKECFDYLRDQLADQGGAYIMGCEVPYGTPSTGAIDFNTEQFSEKMLKQRLERNEACGFDALTGYNYRRYSPINGSYELTYDLMTRQHEASWEAIAKYCDTPYAPCILSGWDCRPYETVWPGNPSGTNRSCYAPDRTKEAFTQHIVNAYEWTKANPEQSCGLGLIYAWDEVTEGGYLIPTKGEGFSMLEGLKSAVDIIGTKEP